MARRKRAWLWLAWGGAFVLVVYCALAAGVSPWPFHFLDGSSREEYVIETYPSSGGTVRILRSRFELRGDITKVLERARRELVREDGWEWHDQDVFHVATNNAGKETIVLSQVQKLGSDRPMHVIVYHTRRASLLDRALVRLSRTTSPGKR